MLGEKLFAVGGYDGSGYLSLVEAYDSRYVVHKILQICKNEYILEKNKKQYCTFRQLRICSVKVKQLK